jgi:hypothetical protein
MNSPTIDSTSVTAGGRPETVAPNTTSWLPVSWPSSSAHAPCTRLLTVTPSSAAFRPMPRATSGGSATSTWPRPASPAPSAPGTSRVGSCSPSSSAAQARADSCLSCRARQVRKSP